MIQQHNSNGQSRHSCNNALSQQFSTGGTCNPRGMPAVARGTQVQCFFCKKLFAGTNTREISKMTLFLSHLH